MSLLLSTAAWQGPFVWICDNWKRLTLVAHVLMLSYTFAVMEAVYKQDVIKARMGMGSVVGFFMVCKALTDAWDATFPHTVFLLLPMAVHKLLSVMVSACTASRRVRFWFPVVGTVLTVVCLWLKLNDYIRQGAPNVAVGP